MLTKTDANSWQGRVDPGENNRWHERMNQVQAGDQSSIALIGFCSDEGVKRNQGRLGAAQGPAAIRSMLCNLIYPGTRPVMDCGDIICEGHNLESAQLELSRKVSEQLGNNNLPIILGGGHEVAWGTYQGIRLVYPETRIGIINFDAHFDLRPCQPEGSSGTPFRQIAEQSQTDNLAFNYLVMGINKAANTPSLFSYANEKNVQWINDIDMGSLPITSLTSQVTEFCHQVDKIYLTICLDVFPADSAPGVSAPASLGVNPLIIIQLMQVLQAFKAKVLLLEIAEMNPIYDIDNRTARLAARLIQEFISNQSAIGFQ